MTTEQQSEVEAKRVSQVICVGCQKVLDVAHLPIFSEIKCPECGAKQTIPAHFGDFILINRLGSGGMGVIYYAQDQELGRYVALKVMKKSLGENKEFVKSFKHEARAAAALNHQHVVQIYSFGEFEGQPYIAMELMGGGGLDEMIANEEHLDETRALELFLEITDGLKAASDVGLVHGDIKPANILFDQDGKAKMVDFGLASYIGQQKKETQIWGTPYYIAPEKAKGKEIDFRSDIYSLGASLFHALAGEPPFDGPTPMEVVSARLKNPAPSLYDFRSDIHPETTALVARMLEKDPTMRYPSYPALLYDMRAALQASRKLQKPLRGNSSIVSAVTSDKTLIRRRALRIGGVILGVLLVCGGAFTGWTLYHNQQNRIAVQKAEKKICMESREQSQVVLARVAESLTQISDVADSAELIAKKVNAIIASVPTAKNVAYVFTEEINNIKNITDETDAVLTRIAEAQVILEETSDSTTARDMVATLESLAGSMDNLNQSIVESTTLLQQAFENASVIKAMAIKETKHAQAIKTAKAKQKAAEQARRRALLDAEKAKQFHQETIQKELDIIDDARAANVPLIAERQFNAAAKTFSKISPKLSVEETRAVYNNVLNGYHDMAGLKMFLVKSLESSPYPHGWIIGNRRQRIIKADVENGLSIALGSVGSTVVLWKQVTLPQILSIAKYYIDHLNLSDSEQADVLLSMALLCYESNDFKRAEICAGMACQANPSLSADVDRMMPGLLSE